MAVGEIQIGETDRPTAAVGAIVLGDGATDYTRRQGWSIIGANDRDRDR